ncbi:MAG: hypothetical protein ACLQBX_15250 [Candidatus Limnocylindrales bacterium]
MVQTTRNKINDVAVTDERLGSQALLSEVEDECLVSVQVQGEIDVPMSVRFYPCSAKRSLVSNAVVAPPVKVAELNVEAELVFAAVPHALHLHLNLMEPA